MGAQKGLIFGSYPCRNWDFLSELKTWPDAVIAADGGMQCAEAAGFCPHVYVGDGDSGGKALPGMETVPLKPEKDLTDLQAAYEWARDHGISELILTACTGGRQDHHLSALQLLETAANQGIRAEIRDPDNRMLFLSAGTMKLTRGNYRYFSLIPVDRKVTGVSIQGAKYPLSERTIFRGDSLTVSNEWAEETVEISVSDGCCYVICSN